MIDRTECAVLPPERNRSINMPDALRGSQPVQPDSKTGLRMPDYTAIDLAPPRPVVGTPAFLAHAYAEFRFAPTIRAVSVTVPDSLSAARKASFRISIS